jgi:hypothetical protein
MVQYVNLGEPIRLGIQILSGNKCALNWLAKSSEFMVTEFFLFNFLQNLCLNDKVKYIYSSKRWKSNWATLTDDMALILNNGTFQNFGFS